MAKILVFNNDTLKSKRHTDSRNDMETFFVTGNKVMIGGMSDG